MSGQRRAGIAEGSANCFQLPRAVWQCGLAALKFFISFGPEIRLRELYFKDIVTEIAKI